MNDPHIPRSLRNQVEAEQKPVTRAEAREWIAAGSIAGMKKVYEQLAEESEKHFEQMEAILQQRITMEFERRSWRGLWARLKQRLVGASLRLWKRPAKGLSDGNE